MKCMCGPARVIEAVARRHAAEVAVWYFEVRGLSLALSRRIAESRS